MENLDVLHTMKDALMKYETIDAPQIDDLMNRKDVRPPAGWDDATKTKSSDNDSTPEAPTPVDEPNAPTPGNSNTISE